MSFVSIDFLINLKTLSVLMNHQNTPCIVASKHILTNYVEYKPRNYSFEGYLKYLYAGIFT